MLVSYLFLTSYGNAVGDAWLTFNDGSTFTLSGRIGPRTSKTQRRSLLVTKAPTRYIVKTKPAFRAILGDRHVFASVCDTKVNPPETMN